MIAAEERETQGRGAEKNVTQRRKGAEAQRRDAEENETQRRREVFPSSDRLLTAGYVGIQPQKQPCRSSSTIAKNSSIVRVSGTGGYACHFKSARRQYNFHLFVV